MMGGLFVAVACPSGPEVLHEGCVDKVTLGTYGAEHVRRRRGLRVTNAETQLASFFAKYEPAIVKLGKALREKLRARLPGLFEVVYVYESQSALVIAYSPTEKGYEALKNAGARQRLPQHRRVQRQVRGHALPNA